jgi:scyllo-inositol 2-dehydrogenase (NADP+)
VVRLAVVGVGKMGLSHMSILGAHPDVSIEAICDSSGYMLDVLGKYTGVKGEDDYFTMLERVPLDAVVIATPTKAHFPMVKAALDKGLHVFCEKPLTLSSAQSEELAALAAEKGLTTQVGYHNRFVAAFGEAQRLLAAGTIGEVTHALAEAYGPVVLRPKGGTWRSRRSEGGGCLYDYAAHPLDLLTWYLGEPSSVGGTVLGQVFSADTEDEVYSTIFYPTGVSAQLSVNWSDESYRKMSTKLTLWGSQGRITVDRQECQVYLRDTATPPEGYRTGWNVRYTTELTPQVWFYVRGEEYSAELDYFVRSVAGTLTDTEEAGSNTFASAAVTDRVIEMMIRDAATAKDTHEPITSTTSSVPARRVETLRARARVVRGRAQARLRDRRQRRSAGAA